MIKIKYQDEVEEVLSPERQEKKRIYLAKVAHWKKARLALIVFALVHLPLELLFFSNSISPAVPLVANYLITRYFLKKMIFEQDKTFTNPFLHGLGMSAAVFIIRVILGFIAITLIS